MTTTNQQIDPQMRYPIGEAAKLVGKDRKTLLHYSRMIPPVIDYIESAINHRKLFLGRDLLKLKYNAL